MSGAWMVAIVGLWIAVLFTLVLVLGLVRRMLPILEQVEGSLRNRNTPVGAGTGLAPGQIVPDFELARSDGSTVRLSQLVDTPGVFVFVDAHCDPCRRLTSELAAQTGELSGLRLHLITDEPLGVVMPDSVEMLFQHVDIASRAFEQIAYPQGFVVDSDLMVKAREFPNTVDDLRALAEKARKQRQARRPLLPLAHGRPAEGL